MYKSQLARLRVGFNARLLYAPSLRGWNRYTVNLIRELLALDVEVVLLSDQPIHESYRDRLGGGQIDVRVSPPMNYFLWEQRWLPQECVRAKVDILHCPFNFGLPFSSSCPKVLTLHDAIDQIYYGRKLTLGQKLRLDSLKMILLLWIARTRAEKIITVSQHARGDLIKHLGLPPDKISVIYEAADPVFAEPICTSERGRVRAKYDLDRPYIFYVGGWEKRKNILFLLKAFASAKLGDVHLVLAGGTAAQIPTVSELARELGIASQTRLLGWVNEEDLPALYAEALCFVYPSEYEGFGLQIVEAMATGCPVLAARATSLPEIVGSGGEMFDLSTTRELETLLQQMAQNADHRVAQQNKAKARSADFSWTATAQQTIDVYRKAINAQ